MLFDIFGTLTLVCASGTAAAAIAYDMGMRRSDLIWEARVRQLRERFSDVGRTAALFAAADNPPAADEGSYFGALMKAPPHSKRAAGPR